MGSYWVPIGVRRLVVAQRDFPVELFGVFAGVILFKRSAHSADPSRWSGGLGSVCLWVCGSAGSVGLRGLWGVWGAQKERTRNEQEAQERKRRVCGSVGLRGLWVCGSGGLWVCGSGGSVGLRGLWGSRKEGNRNAKGSKRAEAESAGAKGAFRRFSEVSSTTTSTVFLGFVYLGGRQGQVDGKRLAEPSGVRITGPKD